MYTTLLSAPPRPLPAARPHVRPAGAADQASIRALVHAERLNPNGLDWPRFVVAEHDGRIVGAVQLRRHPDGSRELGSLVVAPRARGQGIAARLIDALLVGENGVVHMITGAGFAVHYARWGFAPIAPAQAPRAVRRNHRLGSLVGLLAFLQRRPRKRLVILVRPGATPA